MDRTNRRRFLLLSLGGIVSAGAAAVAYPLVRYLSPARSTDSRETVSFPVAEIPPGTAKFFPFRGETAVVVCGNDGGVRAFSAVCTHLGCVIQWQKEKQAFLCPCHAGLYDVNGNVLSGPPPRPLGKIAVVSRDGSFIVG